MIYQHPRYTHQRDLRIAHMPLAREPRVWGSGAFVGVAVFAAIVGMVMI